MHQRSWSPPVLRTPHSPELQQQHSTQRIVQFKMHDDGHCQAGEGQQHLCSECQQLRMQNMRLLERLQEKEWAEQEMKARLELMEQQHQAQLVRIRRQLSMESQSCRRLIVKLHDLQHVVATLEQGQTGRPKKRKETIDLGKVGLNSKVVNVDDDAKREVLEKIGTKPRAGAHGLKLRVIPSDGGQRRPIQQQQQQQQQQIASQRSLHQQTPESQHGSTEISESQHASVELPQRSPQHQASESHYSSVETMQYDGDCSTGVSAKIQDATKNAELPGTSKLLETPKVAELHGSSQSTSDGGSLTHEFSGSILEEDVSAVQPRSVQGKHMRSLSVDSFDFKTLPVARDVDDPRAFNCSRALKDPRARALRDPRDTVWCKPAEPAEEKAATIVASLRRR